MTKLLNQFEAAASLTISPELLLYCTREPVKHGHDRKLGIASKEGEVVFFDESELKDYDQYLRGIWPSKEAGARPHLPKSFKDEVKREASGECALCLTNGNSCEAAHIASVAKSKCNHPHNLLWLCSNHHTKFDKGWLGPKEGQNELVRSQKYVLQYRRRVAWSQAADVTSHMAGLLKLAGETVKAAKNAKNEDKALAQEIASNVIKLIPLVLNLNKDESLNAVLAKVSAAIKAPKAKDSLKKGSAVQMLAKTASFESEFIKAAGLSDCPLCKGSRAHVGEECPVCCGEGTIPEGDTPDLAPFEHVDCGLCKGSGRSDGDTCLACGADGQMERRYFEQIDWAQYDNVRCDLCKGKGRRHGDDCSLCHGDKLLPRRLRDQVDLRDYDEMDCPLCKGTGKFAGDTCPECGGDRKMERRHAHKVDPGKYVDEDCALCSGSGELHGQTCFVCHGEQRVSRQVNEQVDLRDGKLVKCPKCKGKGEVHDHACMACGGDGELARYYADRLD